MKEPEGWAAVSKYISSSSALNPTLLFLLLCTVPSLFLAAASRIPLSYFFMLTAIIPIFISAWQIITFTNGDRDRLQNDKHVEKKMLIARFGGDLGGERREIILKSDSPLIDNPALGETDNV